MIWLLAIFLPALLMMLIFVLLSIPKIESKTFQHAQPHVAILLAARNEESNILKCLKALDQLSYEKTKLTILIGNDCSEDATGQLIQEFIRDKQQFEYYFITDKKYNLKAKANVIEQLSEETNAEYLFITDADIQVPIHWVQNMLKQFDEDTGVVTGVTAIEGESMLSKMQNIDWLFALGLAHVLSLYKFPVTCMGNNMALKRAAFEDVGGYKKIGFSVTEDFYLFRALLEKGWGFKNLYAKGVLAKSAPMNTFKSLLRQRKRWMSGGLSYSIIKVLPLMAFPLFYLGLLIALPFFPLQVLYMLGIMGCLKTLLSFNTFKKIGKRKLLVFFPFYEVYCLIIMVSMVFYFPFSGKVLWKTRKL